MKTSLNLSIDEKAVASIKDYAAIKGSSVSELIEEYIFVVTKKPEKSLVELIEALPVPKRVPVGDLKKLYHEERAKKNGF